MIGDGADDCCVDGLRRHRHAEDEKREGNKNGTESAHGGLLGKQDRCIWQKHGTRRSARRGDGNLRMIVRFLQNLEEAHCQFLCYTPNESLQLILTHIVKWMSIVFLPARSAQIEA